MGSNCSKHPTHKPPSKETMWMRSAAKNPPQEDRIAELETKPVTPESQAEIEGKVLRPRVMSFHETVAHMRKNRNERLQLIMKSFKQFEKEAFEKGITSLAESFERKVKCSGYPVSTITISSDLRGAGSSVPHFSSAGSMMKRIYSTNTVERGWAIFREKLINKLVAYLESFGHIIQSVRIDYETSHDITVKFTLCVNGYSKLRGLVRFIIVMNRYRRDFYAPGGPGYLEAEADFAARVEASRPPLLLHRLVNSPGWAEFANEKKNE